MVRGQDVNRSIGYGSAQCLDIRGIALNHARLHLVPCTIEPELNRTPAGLDPAIPEVFEEAAP